jgi:glycosyltransferase involved in cell wall biosynthesis
MTTLSVVIPAMNEEEGIERIVRRVLAVKPELMGVGLDDLELVVVDDGSCDRTAEVVRRFPEVHLVCHPVNRGYGAALKTGFCESCGEWLAFLDADGTYPPESLPQLYKAAVEHDADIVIGTRMAGSESRMPATRWIGNKLFAGLLSLVGNARVTDSASGMRILRKDILRHLYPLPDGLHFTPAMSTRALHEQIKMIEVPIPYEERVGRSKLSVLRDGGRFFHIIMWTALSYNPVRILGMLGLGNLALAGLIGIALVIARIQGITSLNPWGVLGVFAALVLAVSGVSVFALGATFNYLVSLFHRRPVRHGLLGRPLFKAALDYHFGWMGVLTAAIGGAMGLIIFTLGLNGWPVDRLWLYMLGSAMMILVGLQLAISWLVMRILEDLSRRETLASLDQAGNGSV